MKQKSIKTSVVLASLLILFLLGVVRVNISVMAIELGGQRAQVRLDEVKLRACEAKENLLQTRVGNIERMVESKIQEYREISKTIQDYYTNLLVPLGITVENYDALLADVQADEAAVQSALNTAKTGVAGFACASGNPREQLMAFKNDMIAVIDALLDYKNSIRALYLAVNATTAEYQEAIK